MRRDIGRGKRKEGVRGMEANSRSNGGEGGSVCTDKTGNLLNFEVLFVAVEA